MMTDKYDLYESYSDERVEAAVLEVLQRESWWIKGPEVEQLESAVADIADAEHAIAVNSGTSALFASLHGLDVDGKEVIVPSFTYQATPNAVVAAGGTPVFADIERESLGLDVDDVARRISPETAGIVPVHFGGDIAADIRELRALADEHELFLLEDAAHALGATSADEPAGSFGDAATFSFAFNKVVTTGQGGMVVTDDGGLAERIREFRVHGRNPDREYVDWGLNLVMSSIHAAIGLAQISGLDEFVERRRSMARRYDEAFSAVERIRTASVPPDHSPVHFLYNVLLPNRDHRERLQAHLDRRGIPTQVNYQPCHLTEYFRQAWGYGEDDLPVTEDVSGRILSLPFHVNLKDGDIDDIANEVVACFD